MEKIDYKNKLFEFLRRAGGFYATKYLSRNFPRILFYHRFDQENRWGRIGVSCFEHQVRMIRKNFNIISLRDLCKRLMNGDELPRNTIVFTVDDGYQDFYYIAYPILRKYDVPATIYITTDFIDKKIWLWPDAIDYIVNTTEFESYSVDLANEVKRYSLVGMVERRRAWSDLAEYCLTLQNEQRDEFIKRLSDDLRVPLPDRPPPNYESLSWDQICEMKQHRIDFGSHSCTHPKLTKTESGALWQEIKGSKDRIEEMIDNEIDSFCYPNGTSEDFDESIKEMVREAGYHSATVSYCKVKMDDLFEIGRFGLGIDMLHFQKVIFGTEYLSTFARKHLRRLLR